MSRNRNLWIIGAVALVAVLGAAFVILSSGDSTDEESEAAVAVAPANAEQLDNNNLPLPGLISPAGYLDDFAESDTEYLLLDVRTADEYADGHIEGAVNISLQELQAGLRLDEIPQDMPVVLYCRSGNRSNTAFNLLTGLGYESLYDIDGGTRAWQAQGLPLE